MAEGIPVGIPQPPQPPPPPTRKRSRWWLWMLIIVGGLTVLMMPLFVLIAMFSAMAGKGLPASAGSGVAVIRVEGVISAGRNAGMFGEAGAGAESITEQIQRALRDRRVKALLIRINSPGGSAAGAEEVYEELIKARGRKPVVASMGDVAASGGYYIAAATEQIYANGSTITASIGVIDPHMEFSGLLKKIGISEDSITSGEFKSMGTPSRPYTARERQLVRTLIMDVYEQFVGAVAKGRNLPVEKVKKIADGRILTGRQALDLKLVDKLGGFQDALQDAGRRGNISGRVKKIEYGPRGLFDVLFGRDDYTSTLHFLSRYLLSSPDARRLADTVLQ